MSKFPNDRELKAIRKEVSKLKGTKGLPPDATALDRAKFEACEQLLGFMRKKKLTQRQLAKLLRAPETRVSEIVHYRIHKFTLDRLVAYLQMIHPTLTLKLA